MILFRAFVLPCFLFLSGINVASAQNKTDTTKPAVPLKIASFTENNFSFGSKTVHDSIQYRLDSFHIVHPLLISTGNLGSPGHYLIPRYSPIEAFSVRPDVFEYFGFNRYNRRFYNTNQPYTLLQYFVGQPREQYVSAIHARNFGDNLNFSFHFIRARSEGFYKRQNTSNTSVRTNLWYKGPAKRYSFLVDLYWTDVNVAENGGLANDSSFEFDDQLDRQINEVNLNAASNFQRKRGIWTKHIFAIGKVTDTLVLDTARSYNVITPAWGISFISELYDEKYQYRDGFPQGGFYNTVYRDTVLTNDSTYLWRVNHSVHLEKFNQNGKSAWRGYIGARHEAGEYWNDTIYRNFQNVFAEGQVERAGNSYLSMGGWIVIAGENAGDWNYDIIVRDSLFKNRFCYFARVFAGAYTAPYQMKRYAGNHFRWQNDFSSIARNGVEYNFSYVSKGILRKASLFGLFQVLNRFVYLDDNLLPAQDPGSVMISSTGVSFDIAAGWFHSNSRVTFSYTNNPEVIRLPGLLAQETMYANLNLFKSAMQLQAGIDITWFSEFTAEAYLPAVSQFYLQNNRQVGNYTWISPWVSFRIKPVRVFVKAEHVNAGLFGRKYFLLDHYPGNDLALKIGISWLFND